MRKKKTHSCDSLIFEDALKVFSIQFLVFSGVCVNWKWEASSKNNENYVSGSVPILSSGGCGWERIFYIITLITFRGTAWGVGNEL
jgi:hypothetical protein